MLQFFSRHGKDHTVESFEKNLLPHFTSQEIIEISGEAGSGKTELLYHFIACCVFPSSWRGIEFNGLKTEVTFIDNDCHFDLFRFVSILESRIKSFARASNITVIKKDIFSFIQESLKLVNIIKCYDSDEFILTLSSLECSLCLQKKKNVIMIDGLSSFYWSDRARLQNNFSKLASHYKVIINLLINISKKNRSPIVATRRKLLNATDSDKKVFGQLWISATTRRLELSYKVSLPDKTLLTVCQNSTKNTCSISNQGFCVLQNVKHDT